VGHIRDLAGCADPVGTAAEVYEVAVVGPGAGAKYEANWLH
jgi:hypothetical protein